MQQEYLDPFFCSEIVNSHLCYTHSEITFEHLFDCDRTSVSLSARQGSSSRRFNLLVIACHIFNLIKKRNILAQYIICLKSYIHSTMYHSGCFISHLLLCKDCRYTHYPFMCPKIKILLYNSGCQSTVRIPRDPRPVFRGSVDIYP